MNKHIIVGEPRRCICGMYDGMTIISCADIIERMERLEKLALNSPLISKSPDANDILWLLTVIKPLIQDCE